MLKNRRENTQPMVVAVTPCRNNNISTEVQVREARGCVGGASSMYGARTGDDKIMQKPFFGITISIIYWHPENIQ